MTGLINSIDRSRLRSAHFALIVATVICCANACLVAQDRATQSPVNQKPALNALVIAASGELITGSQAGVTVHSAKDQQAVKISSKLENVSALVFSPDEKILAIAGGSPAVNGTIELWSWPRRELIGQLQGHQDVVHDLAWLKDQNTLVSASADRTLRVWNSKSLECEKVLTGHSGPVLAVAISAGNEWLCSGGVDQTIRVWSASDWKLKRTLNNHLGTVHRLAFFTQAAAADKPIPALASASSDGTVRIWYPGIGRLVRIVRHRVPVYCLQFDEQGTLFTGSKDGKVRLLEPDRHKIVQTKAVSSGWIVSLALLRKSGDEKKENDNQNSTTLTGQQWRMIVGTTSGEQKQVQFTQN